MKQHIPFGKVIKTHGVFGAFVVDASLFEEPEKYISNLLAKKEKNSNDLSEFTVQCNGILNNNNLILTHKEITTIEEARKLIGTQIFVERKFLKPIQDGEFYTFDVIGLDVIDTNSNHIGFVSDVVDFGSGVNLEIKTIDKNSKEKLEYYPLDSNIKIDFEQKIISITLHHYV